MDATPPALTHSPLPPTGGHWTRNRLELLAWFRRNAPSLGELYEGAVKMLVEISMPGRSRFIAHAVREIRNRLPEIVSGIRTGPGFQWKQRLDELGKAWTKAGLPVDGALPATASRGGEAPSLQSPDVPIPRYLFIQIAQVLNDHSLARDKPREAARRLFEGAAPENKQLRETLGPIVLQWLDVTDWFVSRVHDSGQPDNDHDWKEYVHRFRLFEEALAALLGKFFTTIEGLDEILEDTNS